LLLGHASSIAMPDPKKSPPKNPAEPAKPATPPPAAPDAGQNTILNVPPSKFERLVEEVLKKHKL